LGNCFLHFRSEILVDLGIKLSGRDVAVRLDAQAFLDILLVCDDHIGVLGQNAHHFGSLLAIVPQLLAIVQVDRDGGAGGLAACMATSAQSAALWLRAGVMPVTWNHPASAMIAFQSKSSGLAVAMELPARSYTTLLARWFHRLKEVDADTAALGPVDRRNVHPVFAQLADRSFSDSVLRKRRNELGVLAENRQRDGDIGLPSAERSLQDRRLEQPLMFRGPETEHDFTERDKFLTHEDILLLYVLFLFAFPRKTADLPLLPASMILARCRSVTFF
jgi:hypothetical protein